MRVPIRKGGKYTFLQPDPHLTAEKFAKLQQELERLTKVTQPRAIIEVQRLAELGDFSENTAYQMAKGRLRGLNQRILDLQNHLKRAVIITKPLNSALVGLGSQVTIEINGRQRTYQILGSSETDPAAGIISHNSPIGAALIGRQVGEVVSLNLAGRPVQCRLIKIN